MHAFHEARRFNLDPSPARGGWLKLGEAEIETGGVLCHTHPTRLAALGTLPVPGRDDSSGQQVTRLAQLALVSPPAGSVLAPATTHVTAKGRMKKEPN
jgi:hypothetical protein